MNLRFSNFYFRIKWLLLAIVVFSLFLILNQRDQHFSQQWARPDIPEYRPFEVPHFSIAVKPEDYQFLFSDKPESLFNFQNAEVSVNRQPVRVKARLRIRGTHAWNWDPAKPSFRLRQSGQRRILGHSNLNIILPDDPSMLANMVADHIAEKSGIPSPRTTACTVNLNGSYKGLYHLAEPINPESLAWQGYKNIILLEGNSRDSRMWQNRKFWEIQAGPGQKSEYAGSRLSELLSLVKTPVDLTQIDRLAPIIHFDRMASWSALLTAIASIHTNDYFGNFLAFDQTRNKIFPVIADSIGFGVLTSLAGESSEQEIRMPPYEMLTPLLNALFRIPEFQFARNRALFELLQTHLHPENLKKLTDSFMSALRTFFKNDPMPSALVNAPGLHFPVKIPVSLTARIKDQTRLLQFMSERRDYLFSLISSSTATVQKINGPFAVEKIDYQLISLTVNGHSPLKYDFSKVKEKLVPDINHDGIPDSPSDNFFQIQFFYPALSESHEKQASWLQIEQRAANFTLVPASQTYLMAIRQDFYEEALNFLLETAENAITGEKIAVRQIAPAERIPPRCVSSLHSWRQY